MTNGMYALIPHITEKLTSQYVVDSTNLHGLKKWLDKFMARNIPSETLKYKDAIGSSGGARKWECVLLKYQYMLAAFLHLLLCPPPPFIFNEKSGFY